MVGQITGCAAVSVEDLMAVADETAQIMEYSSQLEAKSEELSRTARQLRDANKKLTQLSIQKDAFLSQISHELRTSMTLIRAFSEILTSGPMVEEDQTRFSTIIHDEALRLTRLLDDLLDLSVLENGQVSLNLQDGSLRDVLDRAVAATGVTDVDRPLILHRDPSRENLTLVTDHDWLAQVFINLIANAQKYCDAEAPELRIEVVQGDTGLIVDFIDNGSGIPVQSQTMIFEKFSRLSDHARAGGAGLGLAICREIMAKLGGSVAYLGGQTGVAFRVSLPVVQVKAAE